METKDLESCIKGAINGGELGVNKIANSTDISPMEKVYALAKVAERSIEELAKYSLTKLGEVVENNRRYLIGEVYSKAIQRSLSGVIAERTDSAMEYAKDLYHKFRPVQKIKFEEGGKEHTLLY